MPEFGPKIALIRFQNKFVPEIPEPLNAFFIARSNKLHNSAAGVSSWVGSRELDWVGGPGAMEPIQIGSALVAFKQLENQLSVVFVGKGQQLHVTWRGRGFDKFNNPTPMVAHHEFAPPGSSLAAGRLPPDLWFVLFVDGQGAINSLRASGHHNWQGP